MSRFIPSTPSGTWCRCWRTGCLRRPRDGLTHTITLRKGVKFHNGREMVADDVVASLQRWMEVLPRGKAVAKEVASIEAKGPNTWS